MCGVVGILNSSSPVGEERLVRMRDLLTHRGPDDAGSWISSDRRVGLAHRRLSIIDLSVRGRQPMCDSAKELSLVFNGEIYNFQGLRRELEEKGVTFRTETDTEVVLYAYREWGKSCVSRLNGMFALALFDSRRRELLLARDRMGKKPMYYSQEGPEFGFASECKALLRPHGEKRQLDLRAVNFYFSLGYVPGERSIFAGVKKLLPGHCLTYKMDTGEVQTEAYWTLSCHPRSETDGHCVEDLSEELYSLLEDSVRLRLMSDVPLGILLSGGVDSSVITAIAARVSPKRIQTYTIAFPGWGRFNEGGYARRVAEHFGTDHHELEVGAGDIEDLRKVASHLDEPLADPSILPTFLLSELTSQNVTVALGGDGGDELFGGYTWYRASLQAERFLDYIPESARQAASWMAGLLPTGYRGRNYVRSLAGDLCHHRIVNSTVFDAAMRRRLYSDQFKWSLGDRLDESERYLESQWSPGIDHVSQMSLFDLRTFLPDDILFKVDRASMAFGLEIRAPWLDYRVVEFALSRVPSRLKVNAQENRILQRKLAERLLPSDMDLRRKQGFVFPVHEWMAGKWGDIMLELLGQGEARRWLSFPFVERLLRGQRLGYTNGVRLFACLMFGLWLDGLHQTGVSLDM